MLKRSVAAATIMLAFGLFGGGCADNESALFVRAVLHRVAPACAPRASPESETLGGGTLDTVFSDTHGGSYVAALLVGNQLARVGNADQVRTETARITLRGAVVEVRDPSQGENSAPIVEYTTDGTGFVDPGAGTNPGYGIMYAELIPSGLQLSTTRVNVAVRVFGDTLGGDEIESNQLTFPISICTGCLIDFTRSASDGTCLTGDLGSGTAAPCRPGQDDPVPCETCAAKKVECQRP